MKLREDIHYADFLKACASCGGEVFFTTKEGDVLNLKSQLSRYVFAALTPDADFIRSGEVAAKDPADLAGLAAFLVEE